jgi:hypothetical protein
MTALVSDTSFDISTLAGATCDRLHDVSPKPIAVPDDLASALGVNGRTTLRALAYRLVAGEVAAECRLVTIRGLTTTIFNCLIVPEVPGSLPLFVADVLGNHGDVRLGFFDIQTPGLSGPARDEVAAATWELVESYADLPGDDPPAWAVAHSPGAYLCCRPTEPAHATALRDAYRDYLELWLRLAWTLRYPPDPDAARALGEMMREHLASAPNFAYLERQFGRTWADRFCNEFLYRECRGGAS